MTTWAEDMRVALAEVAPQVAANIGDKSAGGWGMATTHGWLDRETFALVLRAYDVVGTRRGHSRPYCEQCAWDVYRSQDGARARAMLAHGCEHGPETS